MKLDHFHGRNVVAVHTDEDEKSNWAIELDGNVIIRNTDTDLDEAPPQEIVGMSFFDSSEDAESDKALMKFGAISADGSVATIAETDLTHSKYTISSPDTEEPVTPGEPEDPQESLPPDPSDERVADGPTEP